MIILKKNTDYQVWVLAIKPYTQDKNSGQIEININIETGWLVESGGVVGGQKTIQVYGTINNLIKKEILTNITSDVSNAVEGTEYYKINEVTFLPTEQTFKTYFYVNKSPLATSVEARYNSYELETIDNMRENILSAGKTQYVSQDPFIVDIFKPIQTKNGIAPSCSQPLVGLALKTYQSDINTNWVNTEWIDGANKNAVDARCLLICALVSLGFSEENTAAYLSMTRQGVNKLKNSLKQRCSGSFILTTTNQRVSNRIATEIRG